MFIVRSGSGCGMADAVNSPAEDLLSEVLANRAPTKMQSKSRASAPKKKRPASEWGGTKKEAERKAKPAPTPWTFPKNTLEDAIKIARAIEEQNAGNPMKPDMLSRAVGITPSRTGDF